MKKIILALIFCFSSFANTLSINVDSYHSTNMDFMFLIKSKGYDKVILDCQGFINGLNIYKDEEKEVFTLPGYGHCIAIHNQIIANVKDETPSCLKVNKDIGEIYVLNKECE